MKYPTDILRLISEFPFINQQNLKILTNTALESLRFWKMVYAYEQFRHLVKVWIRSPQIWNIEAEHFINNSQQIIKTNTNKLAEIEIWNVLIWKICFCLKNRVFRANKNYWAAWKYHLFCFDEWYCHVKAKKKIFFSMHLLSATIFQKLCNSL